ncbi:MAG TPA: DUF1631 family protein [Burkholderiales bacterium]|nr:DUF1631 family protein [Burkholderiales bacterium]
MNKPGTNTGTNTGRSATGSVAASVLSECREIARTRLSEVVSGALGKIDEDLFQLADKCLDGREQQMYLEAMTRVRAHRREILSKFEDCFKDMYDKRMVGRNAPKPEKKPDPFGDFGGVELSLVSDSVIESGITIDRLAKGVKNAVDNDEMLGIRARLGVLVGGGTLEDVDNPLAPEVIFEALKLACSDIPGDRELKQTLLQAFQPYLQRSITQVYQAVNKNLVAHEILPRIRHSVQATADPMGTSQRMMGMGASQRMSNLSQTGRMGSFSGGSGGPERSGWLGGSVGNEQASIAALLAGMAQGQASARVESLRMMADPARFTEGQGAVPVNLQLLDALAGLQTEANLGAAAGFLPPGYLRTLDSALVQQGTPLDQVTIELVSVVFEYLNKNDRLAAAIKGQIARLQIVAVKAALLDRSFFARREHPMRRLLDRMAEAGCDPVMNLSEEGQFMRQVKHLVDDLTVLFQDDIHVFKTALEELEALIANERAARESDAHEEAGRLASLEARDAASASARADLAARMRPGTPPFIRDFVDQVWVKAVVESQLQNLQGEDGVASRLGLAADLIWSVEPKARPDVPALAAVLPKMVRGLMRGAIASGMNDTVRGEFFNQLMRAHTAAIAAAKVAAVEVPSLPVPSQAADAPTKLREVAVSTTPSDVYERQVADLVKGDILDFSDQTRGDRYRLTWISPKRSFFLFIRGSQSRQIKAADLAAFFRQGVISVVQDAPIIDEAIGAIGMDFNDIPKAA